MTVYVNLIVICPPVHLITYLFTYLDFKQQDFKDPLNTKVSRFGMQSLQISKLKLQGFKTKLKKHILGNYN